MLFILPLLGVDNTKAFTNDPASADTPILLENIEGATEEDFCQELVESVEGSVFDTANFNEKPKQHTDFVQVMFNDEKLILSQFKKKKKVFFKDQQHKNVFTV